MTRNRKLTEKGAALKEQNEHSSRKRKTKPSHKKQRRHGAETSTENSDSSSEETSPLKKQCQASPEEIQVSEQTEEEIEVIVVDRSDDGAVGDEESGDEPIVSTNVGAWKG